MDKFDKLVDIVAKLRSPDGCEWDKALSLSDMKQYLLEEAYELYDSILYENHEEMKEELGDLLFHIVLISHMESEEDIFFIEDVLDVINQKMINRHPHVFGNLITKDVDEIVENWEEIKKKEKKHRKSHLDGISRNLPSLTRAFKIQKKASQVGFDWDNRYEVLDKVKEEMQELEDELEEYERVEKESQRKMIKLRIENELGDLLFSIVNFSRKMDLDPESSLIKSIDSFQERFKYIEKKLKKQNKSLKKATLKEMDEYWEESKQAEI